MLSKGPCKTGLWRNWSLFRGGSLMSLS